MTGRLGRVRLTGIGKIGVVADTHFGPVAGSLPTDLVRGLEGVDLILHAGDIAAPWALAAFGALAPVIAVAGNADGPELALPVAVVIELPGLRLVLAHGHAGRGQTAAERARSWLPDADLVVFGHTHQPLLQVIAGQWLCNPGSPTQPRGARRPTFALLALDEGRACLRQLGIGSRGEA